MVAKHSSVVEAYTILGLDQGASLEVVKSTYKQLALKTHPDKNPGDADATAQFQRVSEAYNTLLKHLDRSAAPPRSHPHTHFHPFGYDDDDYFDDDYDDDDYYDDEYDDYDSEYEEHMDFYMFLFEELLRGRASRYSHAQYHRHQHRPPSPQESPEQYAARLRRAREEQEHAAARRAREEANRKANQERERERERRAAEQRQRDKASAKKAEAEAARKKAEEKVRSQQEQVQTLRSKTFEAARRNDAAAVRKGVWEQNVDASGGELRKGLEGFAKNPPADPKETLLHIAAKNGDAELVEWLDSHGAEPDERNGDDMTAFHIALRSGFSKVVTHLFEAYPPQDGDYAGIYSSPKPQSNLRLALESKEPEMVWLVLDKHLHTHEDMDEAWKLVTDKHFKSSIWPTSKYDEFVNLFATFGGYSAEPPSEADSTTDAETALEAAPPSHSNGRTHGQQSGRHQRPGRPRPTVVTDKMRSDTASPVSATSQNPQTPLSASANSSRTPRGQHSRRGSYRGHYQHQGQPSSPAAEPGSPRVDHAQQEGLPNYHGRGRGRGRGQFRGRSRGRGRGETPVASPV